MCALCTLELNGWWIDVHCVPYMGTYILYELLAPRICVYINVYHEVVVVAEHPRSCALSYRHTIEEEKKFSDNKIEEN